MGPTPYSASEMSDWFRHLDQSAPAETQGQLLVMTNRVINRLEVSMVLLNPVDLETLERCVYADSLRLRFGILLFAYFQ